MSDIDKLVKEHLATQHKVEPNADILIESGTESGADDSQGLGIGAEPTDAHGDLFDSEIHATDDRGNPVINQNGTWRKKRGRKPGQKIYARSEPGAKEAGYATAQTIFMLCVSIGGDEWRPIVDAKSGRNEPQQIADAWTAYYEQAGIRNVPPWVGLAIAMTAYAAPRLHGEQTQWRVKKAWEWVQGKIRAAKQRKTLEGKNNA